MKQINVGLIGFGLSGRHFHAPFIDTLPEFHLKSIRANRPESISAARQLYPDADIVDSETSIFTDSDIDLVVIATSNNTHYHLTKAALLAGKHVLVDKPFTVNSSDADELIELAQNNGKILTVYQNRRWDADFKTIQNIIHKGLLGDLLSYEAHFDRYRSELKPNTWKEKSLPGAGILFDLGSHLIDQALCLFGKPDEVYGQLQIQRQNSQVPDFFEVKLYYPNLTATLKAGMLVRAQGPRYILHGRNGSFIKHGLDVQEAALRAGQSPADLTYWGKEPEELWGSINTEIQGLSFIGKIQSLQGNYGDLYQNLASTIKGKSELIVKPEQARDTIRIIELAILSDQQKSRLPLS